MPLGPAGSGSHSGDYIKTFTCQVRITADAGTLLTNLAEVTSTSTDPEVASM